MADDPELTDVTGTVEEAPEHAAESGAELVRDAAEESEDAAEHAHETASDIAQSSGEAVADVAHEAREHEMHAETRRIVAEGFERVEERLHRVEEAVFRTGVEEPVEEITETPAEIVADAAPENGSASETTETHTRRRRVFAKSRR